ncbi:MAG: peptidoglycan editing factor PgeF [Myxococcaceae bacterium]|nr:peptidoglycan editing factor PgeF [Myxococcaceae bacterium]
MTQIVKRVLLGCAAVLEILRASALGVPHGFTTRAGGVSPAPFDALNLGINTADAPEHVARNTLRLLEHERIAPGALSTLEQVHGTVVHEAKASGGTALAAPLGAGDAVWTEQPGAVVGVRVADCVPVLLVDPEGRRVAAVHAGWRGAVHGVLEAAIAALKARGTRPAALRAAVGPHLLSCCFEVGDEVAEQFQARFERVVIRTGAGKPHVSLLGSVRQILEGAGVTRVEALEHCTSCDPRFFSHRRDRGQTGRHLAYVRCAFEGA